MKIIIMSGKDGGKLAGVADVEIRVPHFGYADRISGNSYESHPYFHAADRKDGPTRLTTACARQRLVSRA